MAPDLPAGGPPTGALPEGASTDIRPPTAALHAAPPLRAASPKANHAGQLIAAGMLGGVLTLTVEYGFGMFKFDVLASFAGLVFVATLLVVVLINMVPAPLWDRIPRIPIPDQVLPFLFLGGLIAGFVFGWLRW